MTKRWYYAAAGIVALTLGFLCVNDAQAKYAESKTLTLAVNIEKHYEVAFDANGGSGSMANQRFTSGVAQALTTNAFTNGDYHFAGWNTSADGSGVAYEDGATINSDLTNVGGSVVTLYAQWEESAMHTVFEIDGTCVFHGYDMQQDVNSGFITGNNCVAGGTDWADGTHKYIDTGVKLYDSTNYEKDYEVGFTITAYDSDHQYKEGSASIQSTFFNAKLENAGRHWPGLAIRKVNSKIEITQTITKPNGTFEKKTGESTSTTPVRIVVTRTNGVVYYSVNGGAFTVLQDINNTEDYHDVSSWFGAAAKDDGTPMRYVDATMTDMYIKVGDTGTNSHTVSFDAGGVVADPSNATIIGTSKLSSSLPSMPNYIDTENGRLYFIGWYSGVNGAGDKYTMDSVIDRDMTLHAFWNNELFICEVGDVIRGDLQACINNAGTGDTIALLDDIRTHVTVENGKDIVLDLNGHRLSDNNASNPALPVIANYGKLTVINGTMTSAIKAGVINNESTGELYIGTDARIIATGSRQAIYNNGGKAEIGDNAYLSAVSGERATVQNLANGELVISGGTIIAEKQEAVKVENGTLIIGVKDGVANANTPVLQGATYGLNTSVNVSMFDGVLKGKNAAINNTGRITTTEDGATAVGISSPVTEVIDSVSYKIIYYQ